MPESLDFADRAAAIIGRPLLPEQRAQFEKYLDLLRQWGSVHRLIGSIEPAWIIENLFLDSLLFLSLLPEDTQSLVDVGSGAGVPGIPIKIVRPSIKMTLLESRQRRASFLSTVVRELGLVDATVLNVRVESPPAEVLGTFDAAVMRCTGHLGDVIPRAAELVKVGGVTIAAGPPEPFPLKQGHWVSVPGVREGTTRRFATFSKST